MSIAENIKKRKAELNMTSYRLAEESGIRQSHLYMIEKGKRKRLHPETLQKLAKGLQTTCDELLKEED